jgi:hypothetical protein
LLIFLLLFLSSDSWDKEQLFIINFSNHFIRLDTTFYLRILLWCIHD